MAQGILMFNPGEERRKIREIVFVKMRQGGIVPTQSKFSCQCIPFVHKAKLPSNEIVLHTFSL
jgi:hypothetical protein